jgi:nucleotide-binding universal stress UspA family protein
LKKIICTTDFSDSSKHAVSYGIALAREFGAKLYMCHVIDLSTAAMYGDVITYSVAQQDRIIAYAHESLRRLVGEVAVDWEPLVAIGHPASEIVRLAEEKAANLVIAATHGRSGLKRVILGSVTERLMRTIPCPLLAARAPRPDLLSPEEARISFQRILVGCDFSPDSSLAFRYGLDLAREFQAELLLAHVIEPLVYRELLKPSQEAQAEPFQGDLRESLSEKLKEMIPKEAYEQCSPKIILLAGQPHEEITKHAVVQNVDLIVLGVRGRGLVETLLVGSTTARVVRQATCPVLAVRPEI